MSKSHYKRQDNDVIDLCRRIVANQQAEIEEMESLLRQLDP